CETVDRSAPALVQQQQNGRDERPRMADSNPPDKIDDGESPRHGNIDSPDSHAPHQQTANRVEQQHHQQERDAESDEPAQPPALTEHNRADFVAYGCVRVAFRKRRDFWFSFLDCLLRLFWSHERFPSSGWDAENCETKADLLADCCEFEN